MAFGNNLENWVLNTILNGGSIVNSVDGTIDFSTIYGALHDGAPGETGANEMASVTRVDVSSSFANASGGTVSSNADIDWTSMPAGTVQGAGIWLGASNGSGTWIAGGTLDANKTVNASDTFRIASGNWDFTLD